MAAFDDLVTEVLDNVGSRNDADSTTFARRGVNFGTVLAGILFDPEELQVVANLTLGVGGTSVSLSTLTELMTITRVFNATDVVNMGAIAWDRWEALTYPGSGTPEFHSRFGSTLYIRQAPTASTTIRVSYRKYAHRASTGDTLEFTQHDEYIVAAATKYTWACLEETESSDLIGKVGEALGITLQAGTKLRALLEGGMQ
jgi:hypothetical protein